MITLAHLSDIHLAPLPSVSPFELFNKRLTGYLNWRLRRQSSLGGVGLTALVAHLHEQAADFTAVTGDLINLGLNAEIVTALAWLKDIGPPHKVCVSPGNHDAYIRGTLTRARAAWHEYLSGETIDDNPFPFVRRIGEVAIISCSSAISTAPFVSAGRFDLKQAGRLSRILKLLGDGGYFRTVLIHHPPTLDARNARSGLWGGKLFRQVIKDAGAEMILHGHTHRSTIHSLPGPAADVPVIGVAAAGTAQDARATDDPARYNLFRIEKMGSAWSCTMREFGFQRLGSEITLRLQMRIY
jgi:3',5'-cyclic AMP phosphodiesterase CpdA